MRPANDFSLRFVTSTIGLEIWGDNCRFFVGDMPILNGFYESTLVLFLLVLYPELLANEIVLPCKGMKTLFCDSLPSYNPEPTVSIGF